MTRPLILDAVGATLSPLWLREFPKNVGVDFGSEGADSKEVSGLPSEEAEVLEQPSEGMLVEGSEWKECAGALGTAGWGSELEGLRDVFGAENRSSPDITPLLACCVLEAWETREWKATKQICCGAPGCAL